MNVDSLGDRMKQYESASEQVLPRNIPVILRLDGNNFSNLTDEHFDKPFDEDFEEAMNEAALNVLNYCSGAKVALIQSDEINVLLRNDQSEDFDPFLANRTQKLTSLTAAKASVAFNSKLREFGYEIDAVFDSRAFVVPKEDVVNVFIWRQEDAFKNCVSSLAYYGLSEKYDKENARKTLHGVDLNMRQEIIFQELDINVNNIRTSRKRGRLIYRVKNNTPYKEHFDEQKYQELLEKGYIEKNGVVERKEWKIDNGPPRLTSNSTLIKRMIYDNGQKETNSEV